MLPELYPEYVLGANVQFADKNDLLLFDGSSLGSSLSAMPVGIIRYVYFRLEFQQSDPFV